MAAFIKALICVLWFQFCCTVVWAQDKVLTIQVDSVPTETAARAIVAKLQAHGLDAFLVKAGIPGKEARYRVRIGLFSSRHEAQQHAEQARNRGLIKKFAIIPFYSQKSQSEIDAFRDRLYHPSPEKSPIAPRSEDERIQLGIRGPGKNWLPHETDQLAWLTLVTIRAAAIASNVENEESSMHGMNGVLEQVINIVLTKYSFVEQYNYLYGLVPAVTSTMLAACQQPSCFNVSYGQLILWKGLLTELIRRDDKAITFSRDPVFAARIERLRNLTPSVDKLKKLSEAGKRRIQRESIVIEPDDTADPLEFRSVLEDEEIFVDLYRHARLDNGKIAEQQYIAIVVGKYLDPVLVRLGSAKEIEEAAMYWRRELHSRADTKAPWSSLSTLLWNRIEQAIPSYARRILLSPDGELSRIPWSQFVADETGPKAKQLVVVNSALQLHQLRQRKLPSRQLLPLRMLLLGNIDFGPKQLSGTARSLAKNFEPLPNTANEVAYISELARSHRISPTTLTGSIPTKQALKSNLSGVSYIHLATHAFVDQYNDGRATPIQEPLLNTSRNPLAYSGIALAGANLQDQVAREARGILTAEQILEISLNEAELVTLSACETGEGLKLGGQGILGLQTSVMATGARSLLMSLWKVDDQATAELMKAFYRNLWEKKLSKAEALKQAQEEVKARGFKHPYFWAGWVLVGEGW